MNTIGSPFFVVSCLSAPTMPPTVTTSPSRRRSSSASGQSVLRRSCSRIDAVERVLRDVEAERSPSRSRRQLALLELLRRRAARGGVGRARPARRRGRRSSPARRADRPAAPPQRERRLERVEHPSPRRAGRVERAALDERLERPLVRRPAGRRAPQKSQIDVNGPPSSRAATIARAADSPTFFTAFRPNRIFPSTTAKSHATRSRRAAAPRSPSRGRR